MNLKKALVTGIAAIGLMASIAAPGALAQTSPPTESSSGNNSTIAYVAVITPGAFDVYFGVSSFDLSAVTLDASSPEGAAAGNFIVYYTDSLANRPNFNVTLTASDFTHTTVSGASIDNAGFTIAGAYNVRQDQCGGPERPVSSGCNNIHQIGDIGYFVNNTGGHSQAAFTPWTALNTLDSARTIQFGYEGVGTITSDGRIDVALDVPANTVAGIYQSSLTLSVIAGTQP